MHKADILTNGRSILSSTQRDVMQESVDDVLVLILHSWHCIQHETSCLISVCIVLVPPSLAKHWYISEFCSTADINDISR